MFLLYKSLNSANLTRINIVFRSQFHNLSNKHLLTRVNTNVARNEFARSTGKTDSSIVSSYLSLFVRRNKLLARSAKKDAKKAELNAVKPKIDKSSVMRLVMLAKPERWKLAGAMVLLLISSGITMAVPFFIGKLIDFVNKGDKETMKENLRNISLIMLGVFVFGALANFGRVYIIQSTSQRIVMRLRQRLFQSIMAQDMAFFDKNKTGELINRLSTDAEVVGLSISQNLSDGLRSTVQAAAGVGMMFYVSPTLATVGLSIVPAVAVFGIGSGRYIKKITKQVQDVLADATVIAEEKLGNIRTVRAFAQEEKETNNYIKQINKVMDMKFKEAIAYGVFYGANGFFGNVIILSVFYFGGASIAEQLISVGDLSAFLIYSAWVGISIAGLSSFYTELMRGIGASARTWEIIDQKPSQTVIPYNGVLSENLFLGDIKLENINFSYPTRVDQEIFKNLDLIIPGGKTLAVVGPSGSGKSTIASLLLRFYDPNSGSVSIGGVDVRSMPQTWLRSNIGTVPQEPVLFSMSIKDNIAYGAADPESVTLDEIYAAADEANAFSFIEQFPEKFNTIVGERGVNLSGGQKQRIALARAIVKNPQILLLDEATSALDAASEYLVQEALERIMEKRTVIIIAHRLSTIKNADMIAVLDKGRIAELGSYNDLMQNEKGLFKELVQRQTIDVDYSVN